MSEDFRARAQRQIFEAEEEIKARLKPGSFISDPAKFMLSAENNNGKDITIEVSEWGEHREEIVLSNAEAVRLCAWLRVHVGNHLE